MRYKIKTQEFVSQRCRFDLQSMEAWSYDWWQFVAMIGSDIYFNHATYSMQTGKQQGNVREILNKLGLKYKTISVKAGLQNINGEIENLRYEIQKIEEQIASPRSRAKTNETRLESIKWIENKILQLQKLDKLKRATKARDRAPRSYQAMDYIESVVAEQRAKAKAKSKSKEVAVPVIENRAPTIPSTGLQWPTLMQGGRN